jgi:hypothetical protein
MTNPKRILRGATVQYSDGRAIKPPPLNIDRILADLERAETDARRDFLCTFAHCLTVEIRALLFDRPVSEPDLDRAYQINEMLHQLTSSANPGDTWSVGDQVALVRAIIDGSYLHGLEAEVGRALAVASGAVRRSKSNTIKSHPER